ncbi:hypothetical protein DAPPUDRAFT_326561 [Daphnia pulex]|uniref:MULE transposase domain-containing protein n=1 Tax=Daphnia pulex TaxID=6669 RepID=E9H843_DAPPU|nr:hypothetical protein DAPPUDRAFT_326561 [Daphnia pulex]|eukprot:EFX72005.1 hypothetical protein DAPPUDRAFT_326561 [Daphnia pulex]
MSHKRKKDYKAVFGKLIEIIEDPISGYPKVEEIMSDFEAAVWVTLKELLPQSKMKGCGFHLNQAMFKNMKKIGLGPIYNKDDATRTVCRQLMSLNLLPAEKISKQFYVIVEENGNGSNIRYGHQQHGRCLWNIVAQITMQKGTTIP